MKGHIYRTGRMMRHILYPDLLLVESLITLFSRIPDSDWSVTAFSGQTYFVVHDNAVYQSIQYKFM